VSNSSHISALAIELKASHTLGKCSTTQATPPADLKLSILPISAS
jgi:hypothetical protein